jgi:hypothetical protein
VPSAAPPSTKSSTMFAIYETGWINLVFKTETKNMERINCAWKVPNGINSIVYGYCFYLDYSVFP